MKYIMVLLFILVLVSVAAIPHEPSGFETKENYNRFDDLYRYHHPANFKVRWDIEETTQYHDYNSEEEFYDEWDKDIKYVRHYWTIHESGSIAADNYGFIPAPKISRGHQVVIRTI